MHKLDAKVQNPSTNNKFTNLAASLWAHSSLGGFRSASGGEPAPSGNDVNIDAIGLVQGDQQSALAACAFGGLEQAVQFAFAVVVGEARADLKHAA